MHSVESFKFPFNYKILCFFTVFRILSCLKIVFTKFLTKLFQNTMNTKFCEIWRSNGSEYAEGCLTAFQWCLLVLSSGRWEIRARWIGFIYVFQLDKVKPLPSPISVHFYDCSGHGSTSLAGPHGSNRSLIALIVAAAMVSETSVSFTTLHGNITQKTAIFGHRRENLKILLQLDNNIRQACFKTRVITGNSINY